jgi:hypothetical protein
MLAAPGMGRGRGRLGGPGRNRLGGGEKGRESEKDREGRGEYAETSPKQRAANLHPENTRRKGWIHTPAGPPMNARTDSAARPHRRRGQAALVPPATRKIARPIARVTNVAAASVN